MLAKRCAPSCGTRPFASAQGLPALRPAALQRRWSSTARAVDSDKDASTSSSKVGRAPRVGAAARGAAAARAGSRQRGARALKDLGLAAATGSASARAPQEPSFSDEEIRKLAELRRQSQAKAQSSNLIQVGPSAARVRRAPLHEPRRCRC
jgi:hypothetical protein